MFTNSLLLDDAAPAVERDAAQTQQSGLDYAAGRPFGSSAIDDARNGAIRASAVALGRRVEIRPADVVKRRAATWNGVTAEIVQATGRLKTEYSYSGPMHLLIAYEQCARDAGETVVEGLPNSKLRDVTRRLTFVPAGHAYREWQEPRALTHVMYIYLDPTKLPRDLEVPASAADIAPRLFFEDATLWNTVLKLKRLVEASASEDRLYGDAVGAVLMHELMRLNRNGPDRAAPARGGLAAWQQRLVTTHVEEHLSERIPLAALARLARLSPFHFARAFKRSFGVPPHRYHTNRRIERAKAMLAKPEFSVTDIGLTVGFSETSSFTSAFRRTTGITPTGYQRSLE